VKVLNNSEDLVLVYLTKTSFDTRLIYRTAPFRFRLTLIYQTAFIYYISIINNNYTVMGNSTRMATWTKNIIFFCHLVHFIIEDNMSEVQNLQKWVNMYIGFQTTLVWIGRNFLWKFIRKRDTDKKGLPVHYVYNFSRNCYSITSFSMLLWF